MRKKKFKIDTQMNIAQYIVRVDDIANGYFDSKSVYQPAIGDLNAMRVFYMDCVKDSPYEETLSHNEDDLSLFEELFADTDFISAFNSAICNTTGKTLDFANVYNNAMDVVETKKNSTERVINFITAAVEEISAKVVPAMSEENINKILEISKDIKEGNISAVAVADAYSNTKRYEDVIDGKA